MKIIALFLLMSICVSTYAQNLKSNNKNAQKAYEQAGQSVSYKFYDKALEQLLQAISYDSEFVAAHQQSGDI